MTNKVSIIRVKRWGSKTEREQFPDWLNPNHLSEQELSELSELHRGTSSLRAEDFVRADNAGTVMLMAKEDDGSRVRVVGFLSMTVATLPLEQRAYINETRVEENHGEVCDKLFTSARAICADLKIRMDCIELPRVQLVRRPLRSGISEIKRAERMESSFPDRREVDEDGPSTTQLPIVARKH